jgi:hypothetical protein
VYPQIFIKLAKKYMELIPHSPDFTGLFNDKRLEKRGL